ncbi:MAG: hypothetical protein ACP5LQ_09135 [Candidatus Methanodesulfokora sp.]
MSERAVGVAFGILYIMTFFSPLGGYHSLSEPYVSGCIRAYMTPSGYVSLFLGLILLLRIPKNKPISLLLIIGGPILIWTYETQGAFLELFLDIWHGRTCALWYRDCYDVDFYSPIGIPFCVGTLSFLCGLLLGILHGDRSSESPKAVASRSQQFSSI